jgi:hypothetical protein
MMKAHEFQPWVLGSGLPLGDWQFWVATLIAVAALWLVARMVIPSSWLPGGSRPRGRKVTLTVGGARASDRAKQK